MKTINMFAIVCLAVVGCASHPNPTDANYPNNQKEESAMGEPKENNPCTRASGCDSFDKAGDYVASGSRFIYDESIKAWRYATSDDVKKSLEESAERMKLYLQRVEALEKALTDDSKKEEEKK